MATKAKTTTKKATKAIQPDVAPEIEAVEAPETDEVVDLDEVKDITALEAEITKETVFEVLRSFTANIGVNGTTEATTGQKIRLSKLDDEIVRALVEQGYIKIIG